MSQLSRLLERRSTALASDCSPHQGRKVATIQENLCIGCTLCLEPCPTDAIVGAPKLMHSVISENCTGCGLCVEHCPVDCIDMKDVPRFPHKGAWPEYRDNEISKWRILARNSRARRHQVCEIATFDTTTAEIKHQIRDAVNREHNRRWKVESKRTRRASCEAKPE